jgi:hypothetical protein
VKGHDEMPRTSDEEEPCVEVYSRDVQAEESRAGGSAVAASEDLARSEVAERAAVAAVAAVVVAAAVAAARHPASCISRKASRESHQVDTVVVGAAGPGIADSP